MSFSTFSSVMVSAGKRIFSTAGVIGGFFSLAMMSPVEAQVSERSSNWIRGVAHVSLDRNGKSQITFNPRRCRELGPDLCEFFRTHEYGHVNLRHLERGVPAPQAEAEADRWAAQHASPSAVLAAKKFFLSGQGGSRVHGTPQERARRMETGTVITRNVTQAQPRSRIAPKRYSATPNRVIRYVAKPAISSSHSRGVTSSNNSRKSTVKPTARPTARPTSQTVRYVVKSAPQRSQYSTRTSAGYVPRGDFLNPR